MTKCGIEALRLGSQDTGLAVKAASCKQGRFINVRLGPCFDRYYSSVLKCEAMERISRTLRIHIEDWSSTTLPLLQEEKQTSQTDPTRVHDECSALPEQGWVNIERPSSVWDSSKIGYGVQVNGMAKRTEALRSLLQTNIDVIILERWGRTVREASQFGPLAPADMPVGSGEQKVFTELASTLVSLGLTILVATDTQDDDMFRSYWVPILQNTHRRPVIIATDGITYNPYPAQCSLHVGYMANGGNGHGSFHADADKPETKHTVQETPMSFICEAKEAVREPPADSSSSFNMPDEPFAVLYIGRSPRLTSAALGSNGLTEGPIWERMCSAAGGMTMLLVDKDPPEHQAKACQQSCIRCVSQLGQSAFHKLLLDARFVIFPKANGGNPTPMESLACGTPVIMERGHHLFVEAHAMQPFAFMWSNESELLDAVRDVGNLTRAGNKYTWVYEDHRPDVVQRKVGELIHHAKEQCAKLS
jgi:hypothetical protein